MAEPTRVLTVDGQEVTQDDVNDNAANAARATDRTLAEIFRLAPNDSGGGAQTSKAILPFAFYGSPATSADYGIVSPTGSADGSVLVAPFRAVLGSIDSSTPDLNWRDVRSAVFTGSDVTKKPQQRQALTATAANNRWDLIWGKLKLDSPSSDVRFVRDGSTGTVTLTPGTLVERTDELTIGVTAGVEAANPTRPSLPADAGADHYFPLAYVRLVHPHTGGTTLLARQIHEVAPTVPLSRATGAVTLQPGSSQYVAAQTVIANGGDFSSTTRPNAYLPSTMVGGESRFFAFDWDAATKTHPLSATTVIDDTIDWRRRSFKYWYCAVDGSPGDKFVWNAAATGNIPSAAIVGTDKDWGFGQSYLDDGTGICSVAGGVAAILSVGAMSAAVFILVNLTDGKLYAVVDSDPSCRLFLWIEATGPFSNK